MNGLVRLIAVYVLICAADPCLAAGRQDPAPPDAPVTFARDIAPLVFQHCSGCHRPGGPAPFSLLSYAEIRPRARQVVEAVSRRAMPPWKPDPGSGNFAGARRLSDEQVRLFERWQAAGSAPGDLRDAPSPPVWRDDWQLGKPDLVLSLKIPYLLPPGGGDRLRNFVIPVPTDSERYVRAWEFRTDNPAVVHHATMVLDPTRTARRFDDADDEAGYEGLIPLSAQNPDGYFLGWTPGQSASVAPAELAWRLAPQTDLVLMLHLTPTGRREQVSASVALYFADRPPARRPVMIRLNRQDLDIPAGERHYVASDSYTLPVAVDVYGVQPHAHNLAREITAAATLPDGRTVPLIHIGSWDFHWQDAYRYETPLSVPAGTILRMQYVYDNSSDNRANPNFPPRRVTYGQRTSDEMGDLWIQVVPKDAADQARLTASLRQKLLPQNITGYRMMIAADPGNLALHDDLALLHVQAGDLPAAAVQFAESLRLAPGSPAAHYNLANAQLLLRQLPAAETQFRAAVAINPAYGLAQQGLGLALKEQGRLDEAGNCLEAAVRLLQSAEAHYNLGVLRQQQGQAAAARAEYQAALRAEPHHALSLSALAQLDRAVPHGRGR